MLVMKRFHGTKLKRKKFQCRCFNFTCSFHSFSYVFCFYQIKHVVNFVLLSLQRVIAEIGTNVAVSSTDICETEDPCQNGGVCITTDDGPVCDCSNIEFEGTFCEKGKW